MRGVLGLFIWEWFRGELGEVFEEVLGVCVEEGFLGFCDVCI